jgi:hypothetical protein
MSLRVQRAIILGLILLGVLTAGFFGLRAFVALRDFRRHGPPPVPSLVEALNEQPLETDVELIRDWMTVPYISKTYQVHPRILFDALGISPRGNEGKSLAQLNEEFFPQSPGLAIELVKAVIRAHQPPPTAVVPEAPHPPVQPIGPLPP